MSLWPALPVELKRLILELVAINDVHDARSLRLVSRDINVLVLPVIFSNISIEHMNDLTAVTSTIFPPPTPYQKLRNTIPEPPRLLSSYNTTSLALLLRENLPSIENALATIGPVFSRIRCLAITSRNLSSNAFWLRANNVRPEYIMLPHHGSPRPVNWRDAIFSQVTHIFTSSLDSHGPSTLSDLSNVTHIAVYTHTELLNDKIRYIAGKLEWLLDPLSFPRLQALVLALGRFPRPPHHKPIRYPHDVLARERYTTLLSLWRTHLTLCLPSSKFYILPDPHCPHEEWENWIHGDSLDIWQQAAEYRLRYPNSMVLDPRKPEVARDLDQWLSLIRVDLLQFSGLAPIEKDTLRMRRASKIEWEIDLVQREGYREFDRLDPEEAGEYEHVLGF
ncbi:hypothetical protein P691DRAFT_812582 [Macrolepiota fuliginosa MF-IS2]|uniref:Uncharacterized protein n=1 Tax=Macrolepiota fuliginosa MF-IS2 TaxID=1400762 RepID=A0A9P5XDI2_9AGAR|nr:hypothetical protein P691DRAFT_812582 [Macrolepiota fuliginosa MF-IS2]